MSYWGYSYPAPLTAVARVTLQDSSDQRTNKKAREALCNIELLGHELIKERSNGMKRETAFRKEPFHELLVEPSFLTNRNRHFSFLHLPFDLAFHRYEFLSVAISFSCCSKNFPNGIKINSYEALVEKELCQWGMNYCRKKRTLSVFVLFFPF